MASWVEKLSDAVDNIFSTSFDVRKGQVVPTTQDVTSKQAVELDATFLYADLAGSGQLASACPWTTTATIIRAFLDCSTRLIRAYGGEIRSFDGDRVMGVFLGDSKEGKAANCAREIDFTVENIIGPKAFQKYKSVKDANIKIKCGVGVDTGLSRAVRAGIRDNNDLIWIGRAPSMAAKLSDIREYPYSVFIHSDIYSRLNDAAKYENNENIWESRTYLFGGSNHTVYRTKFPKTP